MMADSSEDDGIIAQTRKSGKFGSTSKNQGSGKKGLWTAEEDERLAELYRTEGCQRWPQIASQIPGRTYKQCCERWHNHVNPDIRKGPWSEEEYRVILREHYRCGTNWSDIAKHLPGRTGFAVKSHWKGSLFRKVEGYLKSVNKIDPAKNFKSYTEFKQHYMEMPITEQDITDILGYLRKNIQASLRRLSRSKAAAGEDEDVVVETQSVPLPSAKKARLNVEADGGPDATATAGDSSDSEDENTLELMTAAQHDLLAQQQQQQQMKSTTTRKTIKKETKRERILWSHEEDHNLREAVKKHPTLDWLLISMDVPAKTPLNCRNRWIKHLDPTLKKGHWTEEEDNKLTQLIFEHGPKYTEIAESLPGRTGKQCRNRWLISLDPMVSKTPYSAEEYKTILREKQNIGNNWKAIAAMLRGRHGGAVGNHFHNYMQRKITQYMNSVGHGVNSSGVSEDGDNQQEFDNRFATLTLTDSVLDALVYKLTNESTGDMHVPPPAMRRKNVVRDYPAPPIISTAAPVTTAVAVPVPTSAPAPAPAVSAPQQPQQPQQMSTSQPPVQHHHQQHQQQFQQQMPQSIYTMNSNQGNISSYIQQPHQQLLQQQQMMQSQVLSGNNFATHAAVPVAHEQHTQPQQQLQQYSQMHVGGMEAGNSGGATGESSHEATLLKKRKIVELPITESMV